MILITAGVTTLIVSALWMLGIASAAYFMKENSPSFSVNISAPSTAEVGETVVVLMEITNPTDQTLTLNTIDLADTLLDGFTVSSVSPSASSYNSFGSTSYQFSKTISAGESYEVTLVLEATKPGVWTGDVDFSNPSLSFVTSSTTIRVNKPGTHPSEPQEKAQAPPFVLGIETQHQVTLGENFTLRVDVTNPTDEPMLLDFIDFGGTLPEGLALQGVSSAPKTDESYEEKWSLLYSKTLAPGEKFAAEFAIKAVKEGIWTGDLDFWDDASDDPASSSLTIRVDRSAAETQSPD